MQCRSQLPIIISLLVCIAFVLRGIQFGLTMPGDLFDARFNHLILEHFYQWVTGMQPSFWNGPVFYPFPLTTAFSDNHLGSAWIYAIGRLLRFTPETAFQIWYIFGYIFNFIACCYAARRLGFNSYASSLAAIIYTLALPVIAKENHVQLVYRWAIPLAMLYWINFYRLKKIKFISIACVLVAIQTYIAIYTGYFLVLLLLATGAALGAFPFSRLLWVCHPYVRESAINQIKM